MYYTVDVKRVFSRLLGFFLALALTACGGGLTPPATPRADSAAISRPVAPSRELQTSLPAVCECILRFDHLNIEQGLSQSSIHVIFQDSRGFMWFGTQDGLNRFDGYNLKVYKPDLDRPDNLSDRWVNAILEDEDGYLWIGTRQGGLNRFDPRLETFTHYVHSESDPASLNDDHINMLYRDRANIIWVGTPAGLDRYDKTTDSFIHYLADPEGIRVDKITAMYHDSRGQYWLGTMDGGLKKFDPVTDTVRTYQSIQENPGTLSSDHVTAIIEDTYYVLWVGTRNGLNRFDPNTGRFDRFVRAGSSLQDVPPDNRPPSGPSTTTETRSPYTSLSSNTINALKLDGTGNLWVGTANGLNRFVPGRGFVQYFHDPSFSRGLSENKIISFFEDRSGILWIGTHGGGVNIYDRQRDLFSYYRHNPKDPNSLPDNFISAIHIDSQGYAWIGTQSSGLNRFSWENGQAVNYRNEPGNPESLGSNELSSIYEDQHGILWLGTYDGLDRFDPATATFKHYRRDPSDPGSLPSNYVYKVYVDSRNDVWVGTNVGLHLLNRITGRFTHYIHHPDDPTSYSGGVVSDIYEDRDGNLWVGSFSTGLNRFDRKTGKFTHYQYNPQNKASLNNDSVITIYQDSKDRLWVGTDGGGLSLYDPETNSFRYYLEKNGLANGVVYGILEDARGNLWLSTNFGLSRFNPETETFRNFDAGDGLQSNEFNQNAFAKGRQGELYFGGVNGLTVFDPAKIADNPYTPQVALTALTQGDQAISAEQSVESLQSVTLQWPQNSLEFDFAALSYSQPQKNQYAYFLEGFDSYWHYIGTKRDGRYTNLPGGEYTLLLKAANSDGIWNETPTRIHVTVIPPFWQTSWFRAVTVLAVALVLVGGVGLRTRSIRNRNRALERLVNERTFALETRNREMEALYKADERILRNVSLNQVFQTLVDVAVDMLHADRSVVFAWDEKQTKVRPRVSHGYAPETLQVMEFARGEGNVGQVLATGKPIISKALDPENIRPDVRAAIIAEGIRSFMHLPIVVDHKVVAVFNVAFTGPDFIDEDTVRVFSALVNRAAISIANMELFEQTKDLAVMEERNRLARDLHDSAKQKAFAALAQLGTARGILNGNGHLVSTHLNEAENLVSDVIQELTFLVQEIYPIGLQEKGLGTSLREYIFEWENRTDARVQFSVRNERRLPLEIEQALYRITQEAMANVARHSQARRVDLSLVYNEDSIQLCLSDDGRGFDVKTKPNGMGLRSIRERIGSVRGTVQIQSAPGQGTRLIVQVPAKG